MIELFAADTPNGKKISIMLEEIGFKYKVTKINLLEGEQFKPDFRKISPFSKIPVIIDSTNNNETIFESGAILIYLGEKNYSDKEFYKMVSDFQTWKKVRMIGSAAMASVYVASGKADAYSESGIFLWDIAAGAAIVKAAGGKVKISHTNKDFRVNAKFSNLNI